MKVQFDHSYTADKNFQFRKKLGKAGFFIGSHTVEHPGNVLCKFIVIAGQGQDRPQYLEFIHFAKGGLETKTPGLSLGALQALEPFAQKLNRKKLKTRFTHRNYDWKTDSKNRLPGWNFIHFPEHKSHVNTWLTEYEPTKKRKKAHKTFLENPNQVYKVVSLELSLTTKDIRFFEKLCGKPKGHEFILSCGTLLRYTKSNKTRLQAIVLATRNIKKLVKKFEWDELVTHQGRPGVVIKNPNKNMWDVVIVDHSINGG